MLSKSTRRRRWRDRPLQYDRDECWRGEGRACGGGGGVRTVERSLSTSHPPRCWAVSGEERGSVENRGVPPLLPFKQKTLQVQK